MRVLLTLVASWLVACVGDSTITPLTDASNDTTTTDVGTGQDAATDVAVDTPLVCDGGSTVIACNSTCVDIASSVTNCGACNHDCGGGACTLGVCQPVSLVAAALDYPILDVSATNIYFQNGPNDAQVLVTCPSSGCMLAPTTISSPGTVYSGPGGAAVLMGLNIAFYGEAASQPGKPRIFACDPIGGCSTTPVTLWNAGLEGFGGDTAASGNDVYWTYYKNLQHANCSAANTCSTAETLVLRTLTWPRVGLSADSSGIYYVDPTSQALSKCGPSGACTPTVLLAGPLSTTTLNTFAYGGNVYILDSNMSGYVKGTITVCPNTGTCTPTTFVNAQPYPTILRVDAQGVYWYDSDAHDIKTCPLTGCLPSPRTLATSQPIVTYLRTDASFVYWATDTQIFRVAK
jgi:hypothetical protein